MLDKYIQTQQNNSVVMANVLHLSFCFFQDNEITFRKVFQNMEQLVLSNPNLPQEAQDLFSILFSEIHGIRNTQLHIDQHMKLLQLLDDRPDVKFMADVTNFVTHMGFYEGTTYLDALINAHNCPCLFKEYAQNLLRSIEFFRTRRHIHQQHKTEEKLEAWIRFALFFKPNDFIPPSLKLLQDEQALQFIQDDLWDETYETP